MNRKRLLATLVLLLLLAGMLYWQVHTWRKFDWATFRDETDGLKWSLVLAAVGLIYLADGLRAVRWAIFLRPVTKVRVRDLIAPQYIGFAGMALLGRPGELLRPYIIARKTGLGFPSQVAAWTVERIYDTSATAIVLGCALFFATSVKDLDAYKDFRTGGFILIGIVLAGILLAFILRRRGVTVAAVLERRLGRRFPATARAIAHRIRAFGEGLDTVRDFPSFVACVAISVTIWGLVALAYYCVMHAYVDTDLADATYAMSIVIMVVSVAGGVFQLPVVGGGVQLATIAVLNAVFDIEPELATSCGILLWLVTFMAVVPLGLVLARGEHTSLRKLQQEEKTQEQAMADESAKRRALRDKR